jgi:hypothetical protein
MVVRPICPRKVRRVRFMWRGYSDGAAEDKRALNFVWPGLLGNR